MKPLYLVDKETGCWNWQRPLKPQGYGEVRLDNRLWTAHRLIWAFWNNEDIPSHQDICHTCDNRRCVNPAHLFKGSRADNMKDCVLKGRLPSKLSSSQVTEILARVANGERRYMVAKDYGVSGTLVGQICLGKAWKHHRRNESKSSDKS